MSDAPDAIRNRGYHAGIVNLLHVDVLIGQEGGGSPSVSHSTELRGGVRHRSLKASRGEDLDIEKPIRGG
jgi:hypothetical protein